MRILAIRGENLASLQRFEVDLTASPLAGAGLYAITGPTGAGKSTLLDALCLALYDTTPRLDERGGAAIGREDDEHKLTANDVRNILRRGAGEGFAEVDFIGRDKLKFRARWTVHRARKKADGKFQAQKVELWRLDEAGELHTLTTDRKTDTLGLIAEKVGLRFDQFRRSVLLAQGEFDRFLKAEPRQRGELLEAMTGADLYRRLGQGAHRRKQEQQEVLGRLQDRVDGIEVLGEALRRRVEHRVGVAESWVAAAEHRRGDLDAAARWFEGHGRLAREEDEAIDALDRVETERDAAEGLKDRLDAVEGAEPHRDTLRGADEAGEGLRGAQALLEQRARALAGIEVEWTRAQAGEAAASAARAAARAEAAAAAEGVAEARRLDAALAEAERAAARAAGEADALDGRAREAAARLGLEQAAQAEHRRTIDEAERWLAAHAAVGAVAAQWDRWAGRLRALVEARAAAAEAARREAEAGAGTGAAEAAVEAAKRRWEEAEAALKAARAAADSGAMQQAKAAVAETERRLELLAVKDHALKNLRDRAHEAARLGAGRAAAEEARGEAKKARSAEKARAKRLEKRIAEGAAALVDDERRLALMRAGLSLAEHRAGLVEGEPCPLCGATEHPGVEVAESEAIVGAEAERVEALRAALAADRTELALASERARTAQAQAAQAEGVIEEATAALLRVAADWEMARMAYGADVPAAPLGAEGAIGAAIESNHAAREAAERALSAAREAVAAVEARREAIEGLRAAVDAARDGLMAAWEAQRAAQAEVERAGEKASRLAEAAAEIQAELDGGFSGWAEWSAGVDPEAFAELAAGRVEDHGHRSRRLVAARGALVEAEGELRRLVAEVDQRREAVEAARAAVDAARVERDAIAAQRATLFEGRAVEAVEAGFLRAVQKADAEASAARDARAAVEARRESMAELLAEAEKARDRARRAAESARALLVEALEALEIDERTLRDRLSEGPEWVSRTRDRLAEIDRRLMVAQALHAERRRARELHERAGRPGIDPAALAAARAEADAALRAFREALEEDRAVLRQDDRAREKQAGLAPGLLAEEQKLRVLADLSELIGSHDGGRFRDFAQSLTLDAVVGLANSHLRELAPRYALMRVPSEDLELQVIDRDMGDEIRSVQSLSGGESFLVSLALALGLASLSARDTRLESLFIDEGFGSLDDKTLDQALSTLDMLQASGRQVGLISHVPNFSDRIGIQVAVVPEGPGRSRVEVRGVAG